VEEFMSIQKKSLISTLKAAKKANVASDKESKGSKISSNTYAQKAVKLVHFKK
jgi:hypothetical protein